MPDACDRLDPTAVAAIPDVLYQRLATAARHPTAPAGEVHLVVFEQLRLVAVLTIAAVIPSAATANAATASSIAGRGRLQCSPDGGHARHRRSIVADGQ